MCSKGGASRFLWVSILVLCVPPEDAPDPPEGHSRLSHGVQHPPCSPAAIYTRNNLPRRWCFSPFWTLHPVLKPGLNVSQYCLQCFTGDQIQHVLLDHFSMEAQGGLLAPMLVLREDLFLKARTIWTDPASSGLGEKTSSFCQPFMLSFYI